MSEKESYIGCVDGNEDCGVVQGCMDDIKELEEYNKLLIEIIDYCCYDEDFDADYVINKLKRLKQDYE